MAALVRELGLPSCLLEVGVPERDLGAIAEEFGEQAGDARGLLRLAR